MNHFIRGFTAIHQIASTNLCLNELIGFPTVYDWAIRIHSSQ